MQGTSPGEVGPGGRSPVERAAGQDPRSPDQSPPDQASSRPSVAAEQSEKHEQSHRDGELYDNPGARINSGAEAEIAALRSDIRNLIHAHNHLAFLQSARTPVRHGWLKHVVKGLETDAHVQYKVHFWGAVYWLVNIPVVLVLYFFAPSKLLLLITLVYSVYANFATDYGGMSAAMASFSPVTPPEIPLEKEE